MLALHGTPAAIARGAAIGMLIAFTPTVGFQMLLALAVATVFGASRALAVAMVWISNPVTIPAMFAGTYWVGSWFWPGPPVTRVRELLEGTLAGLQHFDMWEMWGQFVAFLGIGRDVIIPLTIGGVLVGGLLAVPTYFMTYALFMRLHRGRRRRARRAAARAAARTDMTATSEQQPAGGAAD